MRVLLIVSLVIAGLGWAMSGFEKKASPPFHVLLEATTHGNLAEVKKLLDDGADVNTKDKNGITALMLASSDGNTDIVELLLAQGADVNAKNTQGKTALELTSDEGVKALIRQHGQPTTPSDLCYAARVGDLQLIKNYLARKVDINGRGNEGLTALIEASQEGRKDAVDLLLSQGADVNAQTDYGLTALIGASQNGRRDVVLLLAKGAEVNIKNKYGDTALSVASNRGYRDIVELLLQHGVAEKGSAKGGKIVAIRDEK